MHARVSASYPKIARFAVCSCVILAACTPSDSTAVSSSVTDPTVAAISVLSTISTQQASVGVPYAFDTARSSTAFRSLRATGLTYRVSFAPTANGLTATQGRISGTPLSAGTVNVTLTGTDATGRSAIDAFVIVVSSAAPAVQVASANTPQGATVGSAFAYDASKAGAAFSGTGLRYAVTFSPSANGLSAVGGVISGTPTSPALVTATITATDAAGRTALNAFAIVPFSNDLVAPTTPPVAYAFSDISAPLPAHFLTGGGRGGAQGGVVGTDNTPISNVTSNAGAALGRVLFYDRRLSANDRVACASCHLQQFAFADTARLSHGFAGGLTGRHSMGLQNARFYQRGRFFWDERAATLEAQVLMPIQDGTEMGMTLDYLLTKLTLSPYYAPMFTAAFGTADITSDRVSRALAQFVRSMVSSTSKYDRAFNGTANANFNATFTTQELQGQQIFNGQGGCSACHTTDAHVSDDIHNTGLDATVTDVGAGNGRFKAPSLRNVAVHSRFMHDGRFTSLEQVVEFYNSGVQPNPNLDGRLRVGNGQPKRLNLSQAEKDAVAAFLRTLTDDAFLANPKFGNPFAK